MVSSNCADVANTDFLTGDAIKKLWLATGLRSALMPRFGALLLVCFSGIWPHVKLFLMQFYFFANITENRRTRGLYWVSTFGKLSLAGMHAYSLKKSHESFRCVRCLRTDFCMQPLRPIERLVDLGPIEIPCAKDC